MKKLPKFLFILYHIFSPSPLPSCRYRPTCSQYALDVFLKYGPIKGSIMAVKRLASCHPFSKRPLYDPA